MDTIEFTDIMSKHFVPYKLAMEMKALGFDEPCFGIYFTALKKDTNEPINCLGIDRTKGQDHYYGQDCSAPLRQQAFNWFRERYLLMGHPLYIGGDYKLYDIIIHDNETDTEIEFDQMLIPTYEEAEIVCLEEIIKILKYRGYGNTDGI